MLNPVVCYKIVGHRIPHHETRTKLFVYKLTRTRIIGAGKWRCKSNLNNMQYLILSNALVASRNVRKTGLRCWTYLFQHHRAHICGALRLETELDVMSHDDHFWWKRSKIILSNTLPKTELKAIPRKYALSDILVLWPLGIGTIVQIPKLSGFMSSCHYRPLSLTLYNIAHSSTYWPHFS